MSGGNKSEIDRLRFRIADLEAELNRQKENYSRKQSVKSNHINDPELDRLRAYIK